MNELVPVYPLPDAIDHIHSPRIIKSTVYRKYRIKNRH